MTQHISGHSKFVTVSRGGIVESSHSGVVSVVGADGTEIAHFGDTGLVTFARSSAKPIQAIPVVESGAFDAYGFEEADLALFCASHSSELQHTDRVANVLQRIGLDESYLQCGGHVPHSMETYDRLVAGGQKPTALYSNCSGKHSGMLAYVQHTGTDPHTYNQPEHPLQKEILRVLSELSEVPAEDIVIGTDGCTVPCFALPVRNWAVAMAKYAHPEDEAHGAAMRRIAKAMGTYPALVAGTGRFDTDLMTVTKGRIVTKGGAEGFAVVMDMENKWGLAAKVMDGNGRGTAPAVMRSLIELDAITASERAELARWEKTPVKNTRGTLVGEIEAGFSLIR